jgi:hypothetical protein
MSRPNLRLQACFERLALEDGAGIFRCQAARTSHFPRKKYAFLSTAAFGITARVVESGQARGRNIGRRRLKLIGSVIAGLLENCDKAVTKSFLSGNARFGESIPKPQFEDCCAC